MRIGDVVALPSDRERALFSAAFDLVVQIVHVPKYDEYSEERLDAWFSRDATRSEGEGLRAPHGLSAFKRTVRPGTNEEVFGPWVQYFGLHQADFAVTLVHELAHLIDRYHEPSRTEFTVKVSDNRFKDFFHAHSRTRSCSRLHGILGLKDELRISFLGSNSADSIVVTGIELERIQKRVRELLLSNEVFARCFTALVIFSAIERGARTDFENEICNQYLARLHRPYNGIYGHLLDKDDFEIIRGPLVASLQACDWYQDS